MSSGSSRESVSAAAGAMPIPIDSLARRVATWQMRQRDTSQCLLCPDAPIDRQHVSIHVYKHHLQQPTVRCAICHRGFYRFDLARNHLKNMHADEPQMIVDKRGELEPEFMRMYEECFPMKAAETRSAVHQPPPVKRQRLEPPKNPPKMAANAEEHSKAKQIVSKHQADADEEHKISAGRVLPTWRMAQRNGRFCVLCQRALTRGKACQHIYKEHIKRLPYRCSKCSYTAAEANQCINHTRRVHDKDEIPAKLVDERSVLRQQLEQWYERCFEMKVKFGNTADGLKSGSPVTEESMEEEASILPDDATHNSLQEATRPEENLLQDQGPEDEHAAEPKIASERSVDDLSSSKDHSVLDSHRKNQPFAVVRMASWQMRLRDCSWCLLCDKKPNSNSCRIHIYQKHMQTKCFSCGICSQSFYVAANVAKHHETVHKREQLRVIDTRSSVEEQFMELFYKCFALKTTE